jgi:hypothetical protein
MPNGESLPEGGYCFLPRQEKFPRRATGRNCLAMKRAGLQRASPTAHSPSPPSNLRRQGKKKITCPAQNYAASGGCYAPFGKAELRCCLRILNLHRVGEPKVEPSRARHAPGVCNPGCPNCGGYAIAEGIIESTVQLAIT